MTMTYCLTFNTFDLSFVRDQSSPQQQQQQEAPGATRSRRALREPEKQRLSKEVSAFTAGQYRLTHKTTTIFFVFFWLDLIMDGIMDTHPLLIHYTHKDTVEVCMKNKMHSFEPWHSRFRTRSRPHSCQHCSTFFCYYYYFTIACYWLYIFIILTDLWHNPGPCQRQVLLHQSPGECRVVRWRAMWPALRLWLPPWRHTLCYTGRSSGLNFLSSTKVQASGTGFIPGST